MAFHLGQILADGAFQIRTGFMGEAFGQQTIESCIGRE
jgi:hypothetical protein